MAGLLAPGVENGSFSGYSQRCRASEQVTAEPGKHPLGSDRAHYRETRVSTPAVALHVVPHRAWVSETKILPHKALVVLRGGNSQTRCRHARIVIPITVRRLTRSITPPPSCEVASLRHRWYGLQKWAGEVPNGRTFLFSAGEARSDIRLATSGVLQGSVPDSPLILPQSFSVFRGWSEVVGLSGPETLGLDIVSVSKCAKHVIYHPK